LHKSDFLGSGVPYWPLEPAILASFLRDKSFNVSAIDLFGSNPAALEEKQDHFLQGKPIDDFLFSDALTGADLLILFALSYMSIAELLDITAKLRKHFPAKLIAILENTQSVTGFDISCNARDFISSGADALLCGEVYANWEQIRNFLTDPLANPQPSNVIHRCFPDISIPQRLFTKNVLSQLPAWELFPVNNYWSLPYAHGPKNSRYLPILTSRGCSNRCDFCVCPTTGGRIWRGRTPEDVVQEMTVLRDRWEVRHFHIEDVNPVIDRSRWNKICRLLIENDVDVTYSFVSGTKSDAIATADIPLYAESGCRYLSFSPETGSPSLIKKIGKTFDYKHGLDLTKACARNKIITQACFIIGHPFETRHDIDSSYQYLRSLMKMGLDEAAVFVVAPIPGSALYKNTIPSTACDSRPLTFGMQGRVEERLLYARRNKMIARLIFGLLKRPLRLAYRIIRIIQGRPITKIDNMPQKFLYLQKLILHARLSRLLISYANRIY